MRYTTGNAFRTALETHLRARATRTGIQIPRLRRTVSYERLLARLLITAPDRWMLKGALALDFRLGGGARPTKDMDLGRHDDPAAATADMTTAGLLALDDHFSFEIIETTKLAALPAATAVRYQVRAELGGRTFEQLVVDVGFSATLAGLQIRCRSRTCLFLPALPLSRYPPCRSNCTLARSSTPIPGATATERSRAHGSRTWSMLCLSRHMPHSRRVRCVQRSPMSSPDATCSRSRQAFQRHPRCGASPMPNWQRMSASTPMCCAGMLAPPLSSIRCWPRRLRRDAGTIWPSSGSPGERGSSRGQPTCRAPSSRRCRPRHLQALAGGHSGASPAGRRLAIGNSFATGSSTCSMHEGTCSAS